jgi:hypothetical protein
MSNEASIGVYSVLALYASCVPSTKIAQIDLCLFGACFVLFSAYSVPILCLAQNWHKQKLRSSVPSLFVLSLCLVCA